VLAGKWGPVFWLPPWKKNIGSVVVLISFRLTWDGCSSLLPFGGVQAARMRIGVLMQLAPNDPDAEPRVSALQRRLQELGWTDGHNVRRSEMLPACAFRLRS
jgi:hypothetical protein